MPIPDMSPRSRMAGGAYWAMMKRIVITAGLINAAWIPMYAALGAPLLAALSGLSGLAYAAAYWLIGQRRNKAAAVLVWAEVTVHAALGSLLLGWGSGFHYFLLIFIPALVVGSARRWAVPLVGLLLTFYLGVYAACQLLGPLDPLEPWALQLAYAVNVLLIFGMFYAMAAFYRATVFQAERRLLAAATTDPLTGLSNRAAFYQRAQSELAQGRRRAEPLSLMLADVDFFKRINDEFGHEAGDLVLVRLAELMRQTLREVDVLARWGGEEFLVLLPSADIAEAAAVAERLRQAVAAARIGIGAHTVQVTMSFGLAQVKPHHDLQSVTQRADQALYRSKREGRNRVSSASEAEGVHFESTGLRSAV
jgi:diguanylate cyclase (GGDEF)-like protein